MKQKLGSELEKGDHIKVWWHPSVDLITKIEIYHGKLEKEFPGTRIAHFALNRTGMTIFKDEIFEVVD